MGALSALVLACDAEPAAVDRVAPDPLRAKTPPARSVAPPEEEPSADPRRRDPLVPTKWLNPSQGSARPSARDGGEAWVHAPPLRELQYMRSEEERGVKPCEAPDPGFGLHTEWQHTRPIGMFIAPKIDPVEKDGSFDLFVHFHGQRPARKELVRSGVEHPLMGVSLGIGAAYAPRFRDAKLFEKMITVLERKLSEASGRPAKLRRLALSAWSRGFEAIGEILQQPLGAKVDAVILLDSFHGPRDLKLRELELTPFLTFARRAAAGERFMYSSHSSIPTREYASTTEATHWLIWKLGGRPSPATRKDPLGLELVEWFSKNAFHARGYAGDGKLDHCAHFGVYADVVQAVARRWSTGRPQ